MDDSMTLESILRFAIIDEQKSIELYEDLAKNVEDFRLRTLLEQLARDEMRHKVILTDVLEKKKYVIMHKSPDSLVQKINESTVVNYTKNSKLSDIFAIAIKKEIETAELYKNMAIIYQETQISGLLISLAEDELMHKKNLELELEYFSNLN
jgi:rubrerythrin